MNKAKLKSYAPQARKDFIAAVEARANLLGLSEKNGQLDIAPGEKKGDVALIGGQAWPAKVYGQRERLIKRIRKDGYAQTIEAVAYTWFNRFAALRYMEIHEYLGHGYRVLSSREGGLPEVLTHATDVASALPGLNAGQIAGMKMAGNKDGELYRLLLVAQCNALSNAMPFMFERIDDESELLLPGNLERTDSVVAKLVEAIPEEDWSEVEVIGWLYQFYISEKKDEVIGKVVKSEDIPAATQLFTPNWIVKYLVQNSVGRLWLMTNTASALKSQWTYYIEPAEQTPEVQVRLDALIKTRTDENGGSLNPETITVLDPACGSGHILVEAYEVLKGIYQERGYQARAIPRLILEKNLYGLDIDDRAAQLAGFALLMKARADDRRLLDRPISLNVLSLQDSTGMDLDEFAGHLNPQGINRTMLGSLLDTFTHAKTFGSLIQIPKVLEDGLAGLEDGMAKAIESGDVFAKSVAMDLVPLVQQAKILAMRFDAVVANPPYMGGGYHNVLIKELAKRSYRESKADLYSMFMHRCMLFGRTHSNISLMTPFTWLSIKSFEGIRTEICDHKDIISLVQPEYHAFFEHAYVPICAFVIRNSRTDAFGVFVDLSPFYGADIQAENLLKAIGNQLHPQRFERQTRIFAELPGKAILFGLSNDAIQLLSTSKTIGDLADVSEGIKTGDNQRFLRFWHEVSLGKTSLLDGEVRKWRPHHKGGEYRRWFGNLEHVINWADDGEEIKTSPGAGLQGRANYFSEGITWSKLSSSYFGVRLLPAGVLFDSGSPAVFPHDKRLTRPILGFLSSNAASYLVKKLNPTLNFQVGNVASLPFPVERIVSCINSIEETVDVCLEVSKRNWDDSEMSWEFKGLSIIDASSQCKTIALAFYEVANDRKARIADMCQLERKNNRTFIEILGLSDELSPEVSEDQITLNRADREKDSQRLISYTIGCMMGRYSLDEPGLIYAHASNVGFDATRYKTFPADADGIVTITDELWFEDDAANRIREFVLAVWPASTFEENMDWLAKSLGQKSNETPDETIRRYLASSFFKDHLQTYKKRPIYWLFSSGKQGAFQALVYLHRYHEGTLARMRSEYVVPLAGKMQSRIEMLANDRDGVTSTAARNKIAKQIESLKKKHVELLAYDEKLRHYADMRIQLDLDDGVKVNYGKFGDLLAEEKAVTGGAADD